MWLYLILAFQGVKQFSIPVGLDSKMTVDIVIIGSVAVSSKGNLAISRAAWPRLRLNP